MHLVKVLGECDDLPKLVAPTIAWWFYQVFLLDYFEAITIFYGFFLFTNKFGLLAEAEATLSAEKSRSALERIEIVVAYSLHFNVFIKKTLNLASSECERGEFLFALLDTET